MMFDQLYGLIRSVSHRFWDLVQVQNLPIRTKLIIFSLIISLVPLIVTGYSSYVATRQILVSTANAALARVASHTVENLDGFIQDNLDAVRTDAQLSDFINFLSISPDQLSPNTQYLINLAELKATLTVLSRRDPVYLTSYALLDRNGIVLVDNNSIDVGLDQSKYDYFKVPFVTGAAYVSPVEFLPRADSPLIFFSAPIRNSTGIILGVLRVGFSAAVLQHIILLSDGQAGLESSAFLLDENHLRLADSETPSLIYTTVGTLQEAKVAELQTAGLFPAGTANGLSAHLFTFEQDLVNAAAQPFFLSQIDNTSKDLEEVTVMHTTTEAWVVGVGQTETVFLAPVDKQTQNALLFGAIVIMFVLLAASAGSQLFTAPIIRLTAHAKKVGNGDLGLKAQVEAQDEIGSLATTFNNMTGQLQQTLDGLADRTAELFLSNKQLQAELVEKELRELELRGSETKYRTLVDEITDGLYISDIDGTITFANRALASILGYENPESVIGRRVRDFIPPERLSALTERYQAVLLKGTGIELIGSEVIRQDGSRAFVELKPQAILKDGQLVGNRGTLYDVTKRKIAEGEIQQQLEHLAAMSEIDRAITSRFDLHISLETVLSHVITQLGVDAADVLLLNSGSQMLEFISGRGFRKRTFEKAPLRLHGTYAGRVVIEREVLFIPDLSVTHDSDRLEKYSRDEQFISYYGVPLIAKGQVRGVLEVFNRTPLNSNKQWLDFLNTLAGQTAIAIDNSTLFDNLQRSNTELALAYDATIEGWSYALDLRDKETEGHTQRVTEMTGILARAFGLSELDLVQVRRGALLHDIGKMGVPDGILLKPGPLTEDEWVVMRKHPVFAYEMLSPIRYLRGALDIPYCHHEKWDGTGYPRGLKGEQIPLIARIFAVVDVWDALRSDRPYRLGWSTDKTVEYIRSLSGSHFDPQVVKVFLAENFEIDRNNSRVQV